jgi:hypothetical protein
MAGEAEQGPEQVAWDRVGQFLGDMAAVAQKVWDRNLKLWSTVSSNIREPQKYGADAMANDAARAMAVALDNVDDIWTSLTRVPERERVATPLPTAFLLFALQQPAGGQYALAETVWIRVAPATDFADLPEQAAISLSGPEKGLKALRASLTAKLEPPKGYRVEAAAKEDTILYPGVYDGVVYIPGAPARPLANLRVVVEGTADEQQDEPGSVQD